MTFIEFFNNPWTITILGGIISSVLGGLLLLLIKSGIAFDYCYLPEFWPGLLRFFLFLIANIIFNLVLFYGIGFLLNWILKTVLFMFYWPDEVPLVPNIIIIIIFILGALVFALWSFFRIVLDENLFDL